MSGQTYQMKASEAEKYVKQRWPGCRFIPRRPDNAEAIVMWPDGRIIDRNTSMGKMIEEMKKPGWKPSWKASTEPLMEETPRLDLQEEMATRARCLLGCLNDLREFTHCKPQVSFDRRGRALSVRVGDFYYLRNPDK